MDNLKNTSLLSESSMLTVFGIFSILIDLKLSGKIITPSQQNEYYKGMDVLFQKDDQVFIVQLKLKNKNEDENLSNQLKNILKFIKRNDLKKAVPLVIYGGFIDEVNNTKRLKLAFKTIKPYLNIDGITNFTFMLKELELEEFENFIVRKDAFDFFKYYIYSKFDSLEVMDTISGEEWDKKVLLISRNGDFLYEVNSDLIQYLDINDINEYINKLSKYILEKEIIKMEKELKVNKENSNKEQSINNGINKKKGGFNNNLS